MAIEEKLQQAAQKFANKNTQGCIPVLAQEKYNGFIIGAKSPESLAYWKDKEKLYSEEEVKKLTLIAMQEAQDKIHCYPYEYHDKWFEQNKKK